VSHPGVAGDREGNRAAPVPPREPTGDDAVDEALGRLDQVTDEPLDIQIECGEQAHRILQGRLADLRQE